MEYNTNLTHQVVNLFTALQNGDTELAQKFAEDIRMIMDDSERSDNPLFPQSILITPHQIRNICYTLEMRLDPCDDRGPIPMRGSKLSL